MKLCSASSFVLLALSLFLCSENRAADDYQPGPDSKKQAGVPEGEIIKGSFNESKIFPGATRDYTVYIGVC